MKFEIDGLIEALMDLDCNDNSCWFAQKKGGMRTNGGCRCLDSLPQKTRHHIHLLWQKYWREKS